MPASATRQDRIMKPEELKKANVRTGLILASIVLVFFFGFMIKMALLSS